MNSQSNPENIVDYIITTGDKVMLDKRHALGYRGSSDAISLAIGWNRMDCFLYLLDQGYIVNENACVEAIVNKDTRFLNILQERNLFHRSPKVIEIISQLQ
jgi:hypothetical protein